jgi:predicted nucleotidyltransferase
VYPNQSTIDELVKRIVDAVHPLRIVLFGSAARGDMHEYSDLDVLVVMPEDAQCRNTTRQIYRQLTGLGTAKDIVVTTPRILREHGSNRNLMYHDALRDGRELCRAAMQVPAV